MTIAQARKLLGTDLIGPDELRKLSWLEIDGKKQYPEIPFSKSEIEDRKGDYLLIYGVSLLPDGQDLTIRNLKRIFGSNPDISEPCFYNQDWYEKETFIDIPMSDGWFFIKKNVYTESRAVQPDVLSRTYSFPSAITCAYTFFVTWFCLDVKLWYHDFVWCCDTDHNGDRIYVGKYNDVDGVNKNGFSIHRHLALRDCYGCID